MGYTWVSTVEDAKTWLKVCKRDYWGHVYIFEGGDNSGWAKFGVLFHFEDKHLSGYLPSDAKVLWHVNRTCIEDRDIWNWEERNSIVVDADFNDIADAFGQGFSEAIRKILSKNSSDEK